MRGFVLVLFTVTVAVQSIILSSAPVENRSSQHRHNIWVQTALNFVRNINCEASFFAVQQHCEKMLETPTYDMNVYIAEAIPGKKLVATLPDGSLSRAGEHDAVLTFDPFPKASFGHFVVVFFLDRMDYTTCELRSGIFISNAPYKDYRNPSRLYIDILGTTIKEIVGSALCLAFS